jgi:hypothetical protein
MKKWIFMILARLLPAQTVDDAIAVMQKAINNLAAVEGAQFTAAGKHRSNGEALLEKADAATAQALRAARIRRNLADLVI